MYVNFLMILRKSLRINLIANPTFNLIAELELPAMGAHCRVGSTTCGGLHYTVSQYCYPSKSWFLVSLKVLKIFCYCRGLLLVVGLFATHDLHFKMERIESKCRLRVGVLPTYEDSSPKFYFCIFAFLFLYCKQFSKNFTIMLFHYDGRTTEWDDLEWSARAIHVSTPKQTKWYLSCELFLSSILQHILMDM